MSNLDELISSKDKAFKSMETIFNNYSEDGGKSIPESSYGLMLMEIGESYGVNDITADDVLQQLEANGIQTNKLPKHEVESGDGEVIRAYSKWHNFLDTLRRNNNTERLQQMETLLSNIEQWRSTTAVRNRMMLIAPTRPNARAILLPITMITMAEIMLSNTSEFTKVTEYEGPRYVSR